MAEMEPFLSIRKPIQCERFNSTLVICNQIGMDNELHPSFQNPELPEIDFSEHDFPNVIWLMLSPAEVTLKACTLIPVVLFGIVGNVVLLSVIAQNRPLHTPTNLLIANMAVADLATLLICPWMFMTHDFFQNYQLGAVGCQSEGFLLGSLLITSVICLCAVSYDRLNAIVLPLENRLTTSGTRVIIGLSWLAGFVIAYPLCHYRSYVERQWRNFLEKFCVENVRVLPLYWHIMISAMVWVPLAIMIVCYSVIFWKIDRYERKILKRENLRAVHYKRRVARTLFIILVAFILLRLPFTMLVFIRNKMLQQSVMNQFSGFFHILWYIAHYMIFLNAAVNPLIYGLTNDNFRRAYGQTRFCRRSGTEEKSSKKPPNTRETHENANQELGGTLRRYRITPAGEESLVPEFDSGVASTNYI